MYKQTPLQTPIRNVGSFQLRSWYIQIKSGINLNFKTWMISHTKFIFFRTTISDFRKILSGWFSVYIQYSNSQMMSVNESVGLQKIFNAYFLFWAGGSWLGQWHSILTGKNEFFFNSKVNCPKNRILKFGEFFELHTSKHHKNAFFEFFTIFQFFLGINQNSNRGISDFLYWKWY